MVSALRKRSARPGVAALLGAGVVIGLLVAPRSGHGAVPPAGAAPRLRVIATVGDLAAIAREVLGPAGDVVVLAKPTQDPHFVDARPNLILDLEHADALVSMGLDYEVGWLPVLVKGSHNARIQPGSPGAIIASKMVSLQQDGLPRTDRVTGDIHKIGNPHFTLDPRNGVRIARGIAARLGALAPENRVLYERNAEAFAERLKAKIKDWEARMAGRRGTPIVTYHKSFIYLTGWLGLTEAGTIEPNPGTPPSAAHLAALVNEMKARHVPVILQERWYPSSVAETIATQTKARLLLLAGMTPEGSSYVEHVDEIIRALDAALPGAAPATGKGG
jgi:zinc/manganese transport system substrate-binding protein